MTARRRLLLLGVVVVVVQVVLMAGVWVPAPHSGGDNAGYVALAHSLLSEDGYVEAWDPARPLHTKYPPLFPALLAAVIALGARTWTALKLVPAAATTVAVLLAFVWGARRRTPAFGATLALLFAAGSGVLWYSHWVLSDMPFTALALLTFVALERAEPPPDGSSPEAESTARPGGADGSVPWLGLGGAAAVLAYFTRSAGLPLLVAVAAWLALRRRWRAVAAFAVAAGVPAVLWWLRGRGGGADYVGEFWMVDPYAPDRGTVGVAGLVGRVVENATLYGTRHLPQGLLGSGGGALTLLGLLILALAAVGWGMRFLPPRGSTPDGAERRPLLGRVHVAELFLPLYGALILLWPVVWGGDRFALPLFPLLLFYAGDALLRLARKLSPRAAIAAGIVGALVVAVPAATQWVGLRETARACARVTRAMGAGPFDCHGPRWGEFVQAARWSGANLPPDAAVLSRKPRIFYVMGGVPSVTYPFTSDPEAFLAGAADAGARYVLLDGVAAQGAVYVGGAVRARPERFCSVASFRGRGGGGGAASQLLGIVDGGGADGGRAAGDGAVSLPRCPPEMAPVAGVEPPPLLGLEIPLLGR